MSDVENILRESIVDKCGQGGLMRFNAVYTGGFETADGKPDLPGIRAAVSGTFATDKAAAIVAEVTKKLEPAGHPSESHGEVEAGIPGGNPREGPAVFAKYFDVDPNHVRDIISEARRMRAAMGKSMPSQGMARPDRMFVSKAAEADSPAGAALAKKAAEITIEKRAMTPEVSKRLQDKAPATPAGQAEIRLPPAHVIAEPLSAIDEEIRQFAYGKTACTSIDIMDFTRYLKDKGYSLQEYIVLEKIYVTIEERKKEARIAIEKEIEGLFDAEQAPGESDIPGLLRRLSEAGLVFEEEDVRRMIRGAVQRRT